jgi:hypothetical protein
VQETAGGSDLSGRVEVGCTAGSEVERAQGGLEIGQRRRLLRARELRRGALLLLGCSDAVGGGQGAHGCDPGRKMKFFTG